MSSISQRTRSKKALRSLPELDIPVFDESPLFIESPVAEEPEKHWDLAPESQESPVSQESQEYQESIDDRLDRLTYTAVDSLSAIGVDNLAHTTIDNFAGSLLYSAFHYPRLFAFAWITGITALAVTVSNAYPCNHSPPARCYL
jgi:hypothetical protein